MTKPAETTATMPRIVDRREWHEALTALGQLEDAEAAARDRLVAARRELPAVLVEATYDLAGPDGPTTLLDMFDGKRQLVLYHFMYAPEWAEGCAHCTQFADAIAPGTVRGLAERDTTLALASRADHAKLAAWSSQHGWQLPWYSIDDAFARDYGSLLESGDDVPSINVFVRDGERVLHAYQPGGRAFETIMPVLNYLNLTPLGRVS